MGYIGLAQDIHREVAGILGEDPSTQGDVVAMAFERVREKETARARHEQSVLYEAEHRTELYTQVLEHVDETEGEDLNAAAKAKVESDPSLAAELRESARKELLLRSQGKIAENITGAQEEVIAAEVERQMELDRFDVEFALSGRIDLSDTRITDKLQADDKLIIFLETDNKADKQKPGITLVWKKDEINDTYGWVFGGTIEVEKTYETLHTADTTSVPKDKYVRPGSQLNDFTNGDKVIKNDLLACGQPLVLGWNNRNNKEQQLVIQRSTRNKYRDYYNQGTPSKIARIDFQTRDLEFVP
jgi:hypothetical protein